MFTVIYIITGIFILGALYLFIRPLIKRYRNIHGKMVVTCPETSQIVGVEVDAKHAVISNVLGDQAIQLKTCTRWPERQNCGQECLSQIEVSPEDCLVRTLLTSWYEEKSCVLCGKEFQEIDSYDKKAVLWYDQKPALISPEGDIIQCSEVPVETLPKLLGTHKPVCWKCFIAETFRRKNPEKVVDRPWKRDRLI